MDLLEAMCEYLCCDYISDLRQLVLSETEAQQLSLLPQDSFSLAQYRAAARYLLGVNPPTDQTAEQIWAQIIRDMQSSRR